MSYMKDLFTTIQEYTEQATFALPMSEWAILDAGIHDESHPPFVAIDFSRHEHGAAEYFDCSLERAADCLMQAGDYRAKDADGRDIVVSEHYGEFDPYSMDTPLITTRHHLIDWLREQFLTDSEATARRILMGCAGALENYLSSITITNHE